MAVPLTDESPHRAAGPENTVIKAMSKCDVMLSEPNSYVKRNKARPAKNVLAIVLGFC